MVRAKPIRSPWRAHQPAIKMKAAPGRAKSRPASQPGAAGPAICLTKGTSTGSRAMMQACMIVVTSTTDISSRCEAATFRSRTRVLRPAAGGENSSRTASVTMAVTRATSTAEAMDDPRTPTRSRAAPPTTGPMIDPEGQAV